jgi:UDP-glucose 4-epimerase
VKILVTGASGFVGSHLCPALAAEGHEVLAIVREPARAPSGAIPVVADLSRPLEPDSLPTADAIVHLAQANVGFPDQATELFHVNTVSTQELLDHARRCGAGRFVYASSGSVYGFGDRAFREDDPLRGADFYALTKRTGEELVAAYRDFFATASLRLFFPYGPGQRGRLVPSLVERVRTGSPVTLNGGGRPRVNPIFVGDAVSVVARTLEVDGHHVLNVGGDEVVDVRGIAEEAGRVLGREALFEEGSADPAGDLVGDVRRMHELVDLRPTPLAEGLRLTVGAAQAATVSP